MTPTRLLLRVSPGARENAVVGRHGEAWKVRVAAPPERGAANRAVLRLLAETLSLPSARMRVVSGAGARDKTVELRGIAPAEAEGRLQAARRKESR